MGSRQHFSPDRYNSPAMRVFVTGATGFAGKHLVNDLLNAGHSVFALTRSAASVEKLSCHVTPITGDLLDGDSLKKAVAEAAPDVVYHLAGQAYPGLSWQKAAFTFEVNTGGTANLLDAVVAYGRPRTVVVTSAEIYGKVRPNQLPISERSIPKPRHPYGISKFAAAQLVKIYAKRYGLPVMEARPFNHIGPQQSLGFVVPDFASQIAQAKLGIGPRKMMVGNLSAERDFTDVRDVVAAYQLIAEKGQPGHDYLICSGHPVSISTILNILIELADIYMDVEYDPARMRPSDVPVLYGNYAKVQQHTGWKPQIHLRDTLRLVLNEWLEAQSTA